MDNLIKTMLEKDLLSEEDLHSLLIENPDEQMKGMVEILHPLLCDKPHKYRPEDLLNRSVPDLACCYFYAEEHLENTWQQLDHKFWTKKIITDFHRIGIILPKEMADFAQLLVKVGGHLIRLLTKYPAAYEMVLRICEVFAKTSQTPQIR